MERYPMTAAGYKALQEELEHLRKVERPDVIKKIAEARSHGDLKENAEYHAARERQGFIEGKIQKYEAMLAAAEVIDHTKFSGDTVVFGATVTLLNLNSDKEVTYQLVGEYESDIYANKLSIAAPLARLMLGKSIGDTFVMQISGGREEYEILDVEFV